MTVIEENYRLQQPPIQETTPNNSVSRNQIGSSNSENIDQNLQKRAIEDLTALRIIKEQTEAIHPNFGAVFPIHQGENALVATIDQFINKHPLLAFDSITKILIWAHSELSGKTTYSSEHSIKKLMKIKLPFNREGFVNALNPWLEIWIRDYYCYETCLEDFFELLALDFSKDTHWSLAASIFNKEEIYSKGRAWKLAIRIVRKFKDITLIDRCVNFSLFQGDHAKVLQCFQKLYHPSKVPLEEMLSLLNEMLGADTVVAIASLDDFNFDYSTDYHDLAKLFLPYIKDLDSLPMNSDTLLIWASLLELSAEPSQRQQVWSSLYVSSKFQQFDKLCELFKKYPVDFSKCKTGKYVTQTLLSKISCCLEYGEKDQEELQNSLKLAHLCIPYLTSSDKFLIKNLSTHYKIEHFYYLIKNGNQGFTRWFNDFGYQYLDEELWKELILKFSDYDEQNDSIDALRLLWSLVYEDPSRQQEPDQVVKALKLFGCCDFSLLKIVKEKIDVTVLKKKHWEEVLTHCENAKYLLIYGRYTLPYFCGKGEYYFPELSHRFKKVSLCNNKYDVSGFYYDIFHTGLYFEGLTDLQSLELFNRWFKQLSKKNQIKLLGSFEFSSVLQQPQAASLQKLHVKLALEDDRWIPKYKIEVKDESDIQLLERCVAYELEKYKNCVHTLTVKSWKFSVGLEGGQKLIDKAILKHLSLWEFLVEHCEADCISPEKILEYIELLPLPLPSDVEVIKDYLQSGSVKTKENAALVLMQLPMFGLLNDKTEIERIIHSGGGAEAVCSLLPYDTFISQVESSYFGDHKYKYLGILEYLVNFFETEPRGTELFKGMQPLVFQVCSECLHNNIDLYKHFAAPPVDKVDGGKDIYRYFQETAGSGVDEYVEELLCFFDFNDSCQRKNLLKLIELSDVDKKQKYNLIAKNVPELIQEKGGRKIIVRYLVQLLANKEIDKLVDCMQWFETQGNSLDSPFRLPVEWVRELVEGLWFSSLFKIIRYRRGALQEVYRQDDFISDLQNWLKIIQSRGPKKSAGISACFKSIRSSLKRPNVDVEMGLGIVGVKLSIYEIFNLVDTREKLLSTQSGKHALWMVDTLAGVLAKEVYFDSPRELHTALSSICKMAIKSQKEGYAEELKRICFDKTVNKRVRCCLPWIYSLTRSEKICKSINQMLTSVSKNGKYVLVRGVYFKPFMNFLHVLITIKLNNNTKELILNALVQKALSMDEEALIDNWNSLCSIAFAGISLFSDSSNESKEVSIENWEELRFNVMNKLYDYLPENSEVSIEQIEISIFNHWNKPGSILTHCLVTKFELGSWNTWGFKSTQQWLEAVIQGTQSVKKLRYEDEQNGKHFEEMKSQRPSNLATWQSEFKWSFEDRDEKSYQVHFTEDPELMLHAGEMVEGSCLAFTGVNHRCISGYYAVGRNKLMLVYDDRGENVLARAVIHHYYEKSSNEEGGNRDCLVLDGCYFASRTLSGQQSGCRRSLLKALKDLSQIMPSSRILCTHLLSGSKFSYRKEMDELSMTRLEYTGELEARGGNGLEYLDLLRNGAVFGAYMLKANEQGGFDEISN